MESEIRRLPALFELAVSCRGSHGPPAHQHRMNTPLRSPVGHGCSSRHRLAGLTIVLALIAALIIGGSMLPPAARADQPDPSQPGPFAVGVTERSFTRASSTTGTARAITMVIWYPALTQAPGEGAFRFGGRLDAPSARESGPFPVLLFSHGSGGTPWQSTFLTAHLASHGFVVIAPTHPGNTVKDCPAACLPLDNVAREAFLDSAANRPADVSAALDQAIELSTSKDKVLEGLIDANRAGALGHSFGGWTALQVLSRDLRFKAAAPLAPGVFAEVLAMAQHVTAPTLVLAGDVDRLTRLADEQQL